MTGFEIILWCVGGAATFFCGGVLFGLHLASNASAPVRALLKEGE